jgi:hypothetical protein
MNSENSSELNIVDEKINGILNSPEFSAEDRLDNLVEIITNSGLTQINRDAEDIMFKERYGVSLSDLLEYIASKIDSFQIANHLIDNAKNIDTILVPPDKVELEFNGGPKFKEIRIEPRTLRLLEGLLDNGLTFGQIKVVKGKTPELMMRKTAYVYIRFESEDLRKGILVCDEVGNATYVFNLDELPLEVQDDFELVNYTKNELDNLVVTNPGFGVRIINRVNWFRNTMSAIFEEEIEEITVIEAAKKISLKRFMKNKDNVNALIEMWNNEKFSVKEVANSIGLTNAHNLKKWIEILKSSEEYGLLIKEREDFKNKVEIFIEDSVDVAKFIELWNNPKISKKEIAEYFGIAAPTTTTWARHIFKSKDYAGQLNFELRQEKYKKGFDSFVQEEGEVKRFIELWNNKTSYLEIAKAFGISDVSVTRWAGQLAGLGYGIMITEEKRRKDPTYTYEDFSGNTDIVNSFVETWNSEISINKMSKQFEISRLTIKNWVVRLREEGYELRERG